MAHSLGDQVVGASRGAVKGCLLCVCLEPLTAEDAQELGVDDYCCADDEALSAAVSIGEKLASLHGQRLRHGL